MHSGEFEDFLKTFKSSATSDAANALEDMRLEDEGTSDEYDFMDDAEDRDGNTRIRQRRRHTSKQKYMSILQEVADRKIDHIFIELDDLDQVGFEPVWLRCPVQSR